MLTKMLIEMSQSRKTAQGLAQLPRGVSLKLFSPASPENTQYAGARNIQSSWGPKYTIIWHRKYTIFMRAKIHNTLAPKIHNTLAPNIHNSHGAKIHGVQKQNTKYRRPSCAFHASKDLNPICVFHIPKKQSTLEEMSRKNKACLKK